MRNAGPAYFYDRSIKIGNAIVDVSMVKDSKHAKAAIEPKQPSAKRPESAQTDVQFFPESGSLVYGIESTVAFKAVGEDGLGKDVNGVIIDEQNQEITRFSSRHLGMGVFNFSPAMGKSYKALITYSDNSKKSIDLPAPLLKGYVLHVNNADPANIVVKIDASRDMVRDNANKGLNLIAQSGGMICYAAKSQSVSSSFTAVIPKGKFPSGIVQLTLFSSSGEPLNERLVFVRNPDQLNLSVLSKDNVFTPLGRMKIDLGVNDREGQPVPGNFSVSVTDETKVPADEAAESTIFSDLLLTSDLRGYIEKPNYYFTEVNDETKAVLDILMLTQGYHRFEWKQVLTHTFAPAVYRPENSLEIAGRLKTLGGKPVVKGKVSLLSASQGFFMQDTVTDNKGSFSFKNLQFKDSVKFIVQSKTGKNKSNVAIELDSVGAAPLAPAKNLPAEAFIADTNFSVYLAGSRKLYDEQKKYGINRHTVSLKEVKIRDKRIPVNSANINGPGNADQVLLAKAINTACPTIAECLIGKLLDVFFKYDPFNYVYYPCTYRSGKPVPMRIMLDGMIIDSETLNTIPPEMVESVEVLRNGSKTSVYGTDGSAGLLLINTKKGNFAELASTPNIVTYAPKGYYKAREFYSPRYDDPKTNTQMADLRSTVYWSPNLATDKEGKASFDYFNADAKGAYRMVIEGIDGNGNLGRLVYRYKVE